MRTIKYDFSKFDSIMRRIKNNPDASSMNDLQRELNSFFSDSECTSVIYTDNTDKLFFGMCVMPIISEYQTRDILIRDEPVRISEYCLELDSKLFDPLLGLSTRELTAILLHEVGHLVNDSTPADEVRKEIDVYLARENESMSEDAYHKQSPILRYGIIDYMRRVGSIFESRNKEELLADEFVYSCGYGRELESAFKKLLRNGKIINKDVNNKFLVLRWTFRVNKDIKRRRLAAIRTLNRGKSLDGSVLEKKKKEEFINTLNKVTPDYMNESNNDFKAKKGIFTNIRIKGIKALEDELYEFAIRLKNLTTEEDALVMLRQVNYRISLIDEYVAVENLSEEEKNRWYSLREDYCNIRNRILDKDLGKTKMYGLWIAYPDKER